ncbi:MAG: hypothetical protein ACO3Z0_01855, partial [Ilumatobacteraceae bacterium]
MTTDQNKVRGADVGYKLNRRELLVGAAGVAGAGALLAACGGGEVGPLTFGARTVDESPTKQLKALVAAYEAKTGNTVTYNATES